MSIDFNAFDSYRKTIPELCYMGDGKLARASGKQRAYIHGLLDKVDMTENDLSFELGIDVPLSDFTIDEAGTAIETLKELQKEKYNWNRGGW